MLHILFLNPFQTTVILFFGYIACTVSDLLIEEIKQNGHQFEKMEKLNFMANLVLLGMGIHNASKLFCDVLDNKTKIWEAIAMGINLVVVYEAASKVTKFINEETYVVVVPQEFVQLVDELPEAKIEPVVEAYAVG